MIPARYGSQRLKLKNLANLGGKPLINYVIESAKKTKMFDQIVVNSDSKIFSKVAKNNKVEFYLRPKKLGSSLTRSDDVVFDFCKKYKSDIIVWLNPICPFQPIKEIKDVINFFIKEKYNSLITCTNIQTHCIYKDKSINFVKQSKFDRTQDLNPILSLNYSIMMWKTSSFLNSFKKNGHAILHGKTSYYPVSNDSSVMIKTREDLAFAEAYQKAYLSKKKSKVTYYID